MGATWWGAVPGAGGGGMTTLLVTIAGIRRATGGVVLLRGVPVTQVAPYTPRCASP